MRDLATLVDALRFQVESRPAAVCCTFEADDALIDITYASLMERASAFRMVLASRDVKPGDIIFVLLPHCPDLLYSFVGTILAGCTPAFLAPPSEKQDPAVYRDTLAHLFDNTRARALVIDAVTLAEIGDISIEGFQVVEPAQQLGVRSQVRWPAPTPDDTAFLQFSSGTTGLRKGAMLTHRIVMEQVRTYAGAIDLSPDHDRIVSWLPLYHDMGLIACLIMPLSTGVPVTLIDPLEWVYDPAMLFRAIARDGGTLAWLPNFAFNHLVRTVRSSEAGDLSRMRAFIDCSEPCKAASLEAFAKAFALAGARLDQMQTCYAMAEAVFAVTQSPVGTPPRVLSIDLQALSEGLVTILDGGTPLVSVGTFLPGFSGRILGPNFEDCPPGRVGEIAIRGPSLFGGYYRSPEASAEPFHEGWFRTGDLGFICENYLYVTGRIKDVIIAYGRNFYSHDIEAIANAVADVKPGRAVAFGLYNDGAGSEDVIVVAETEAADSAVHSRISAEIKRLVLENLNLSVARVVLVKPKWLLKTSSGKINRAANADKYRSHLEI